MENIFHAEKEDIPEIYRLYTKETNLGHDFEPILHKIKDFYDYLKNKQSILLVYKIEGEVAGFTLLYDMISWGYLDIICINKKYRNKGIASKLIEHALDIRHEAWESLEACYFEGDNGVESFFKKNNFTLNKKPTIWVAKDTKKSK
ncbi:Acetyltransferase (GNAT) family protein [Candidatus Tiddalikarchaeum anstoanum]|nr:Acetyltransferase (GNAT) family protein [Candidatus Tiddalikarchaeum anstoanum]